MSEEKKIIIDEDWKSQVEAEREAAKQSNEPQPSGSDPTPPPAETDTGTTPDPATSGSPPEDPPMPPASMSMLMSSLATEALISMGQMPHPATGQVVKARNQAKYLIDTLELLQEKTAGNLTPDEATALGDILHQLRMAFVASQ
ncbi:MAG: DUF1844 domain-containing protein [Planctomycetota bacterium]